MAENTVNEGQGTTTPIEEERTFTQEEVNKMMGKLRWEEAQKYSDYESVKAKAAKYDEVEEASKTELQKATEKADALQKKLDSMEKAETIRKIRETVSKETGVPIELITAEDEETCKAQAEGIANFAKSVKNVNYPSVKDGGEVTKASTTTKEEILAIKDEKQRLKAIEANIQLFT